jgi:TfoX/Sxy family transcriptional regulator of competence genes
MAYDETLAVRVRDLLGDRAAATEKKMFGGLAFMVGGNMCCGVHGDELIVRLEPEGTDQALEEQHVRVFDLTGRPMKGWVLVAPAGVASDDDLRRWVDLAVEFASSLPAKRTRP